jgi:NAD(P)-dependent dehydrogenase (short-subunit alcohol dehydrogenase family)
MNPVDKVVLIINGDAGSGSYIAENLAKNGCKIALTYNNKSIAENIKKRIEKETMQRT